MGGIEMFCSVGNGYNMPQIEMVTYGDTALFSAIVFWSYFINLVIIGSTVTALFTFASFFRISIITPLARFYALMF